MCPAVPIHDPRWSGAKDLADLNRHTLKEIEHFYATYKKLQNKEVVVEGFEGRAEAQAAFEACGGASNDVHRLDSDKDGIVCESLP